MPPARRWENPVHTYLTDDDLERLDQLAEERDLSRSAIARQLLRLALDEQAKQAVAS
jgi:predicted transcriptional regulator